MERDLGKGVDPYQGQSLNQWINPAAFTDPPNAIGRFGDSQSGAVQGPATKVVSLSLLKRIPLTESSRLEFGAQVSNVFNHPNYAPPNNLTLGVPAFGQITAMQSAEGAGPRDPVDGTLYFLEGVHRSLTMAQRSHYKWTTSRPEAEMAYPCL